MENVFRYKSFNNAPFYNALLPTFFASILSAKTVFYGALVVFGFIFYKKDLISSLFLYTLVLVIFSSAIANQYLAIIIPAISIFPNILYFIFTFFASIYLLVHSDGMHIQWIISHFPNLLVWDVLKTNHYYVLISLLFFGFVINLIKDGWRKMSKTSEMSPHELDPTA